MIGSSLATLLVILALVVRPIRRRWRRHDGEGEAAAAISCVLAIVFASPAIAAWDVAGGNSVAAAIFGALLFDGGALLLASAWNEAAPPPKRRRGADRGEADAPLGQL